MANELFCMGCMQPISEFSDSCYHCGYPTAGQNPQGYLPVRTQLSGRYTVGRALEKRQDAIVYIGFDKTARNVVLIREFFPEGVAQRLSMQVMAKAGKEGVFEQCFDEFRKQARTIARLREVPAMIPVYDLFEENGTMYVIADRVEGIPFRRHLQALGGHMKWEEVRPLFVPLITSLMAIHSTGLTHLGISPDSILLDSTNRLRLDGWQIAFARTAAEPLPSVLPEGYAAPEQYASDTVFQAADVYAVGATMLYALTGEEPPAATARVSGEASLMVPAALAEKWPAHIAPTLCDALALNAKTRISTVEMLRDRLTTAPVVEALLEEPLEGETAAEPTVVKVSAGYKAAVIVLSILCAVLAAAIAWLTVTWHPWAPDEPEEEPAAVTTTTLPTVVNNFDSSAYAVEEVVGLTMAQLKGRQLRGNMSVKVVGTKFSDTVPAGVILTQDPMPESSAEVSAVIEVYLSAGAEKKRLPDLKGWDRVAARAYLEALGYTVSEVEVTVSDQERGAVETSFPAPGTELMLGDEVVLHISNVPTTTTTTTTTTTATTAWAWATTTTSPQATLSTEGRPQF